VKRVRHKTVKIPPARAAARHAAKTATVTHRATGRAVSTISRPAAYHATASARHALRAVGVAVRPGKATTHGAKITKRASGLTTAARRTTAAAAKADTATSTAVTGTGKDVPATTGQVVTTATGTALDAVEAVRTGTATTAVRLVSDSATSLTLLLQPVSRSVLGATSQLTGHAAAALGHAAGILSPGVGTVGDPAQTDSGTARQAPPSAVLASQASSSAGDGWAHREAGTAPPTTSADSAPSSWIATLVDLVRDASGALLRTGAPAGGTVTAVALLTLTAGVVAAGAGGLGSTGSASVALALLENSLVPNAAGASRRFVGAGRRVGWRLPARPSFSPD